jgi:predicted dienelactone hydrolase
MMRARSLYVLLLVLLLASMTGTIFAQGDEQFINGDLLPDAPALAPRGEYGVGVQTMELVHADQLDVLNATETEIPLYDRPLTIEVWYPAIIPEGEAEIVEYEDVLGIATNPNRPITPFTFLGRALQDAEPDASGGAYPLVIVSHGYPGSRLMMSYLTENLASKGYVVVSIAHTESTFSDANAFTSTLVNRALDVLFVLDELAAMGAADSNSFLAGLVDADNTALVGYSMGGYGSLNAAGAGYSEQAVQFYAAISGGFTTLEIRATGNPDYEASMDDRIKAVVAFAPWGMERGLWDAEGLAGLTVPTMFVVGSEDDVAGYENGVRALYEGAVNADRYLLTYVNARHNVAPNPPPPDALEPGLNLDEYLRYAEPAWNAQRINNINQHFLTAFLGINLKGEDFGMYLDLIENANDGVFELDDDNNPTENHTHWEGFLPRTAVGMMLEHATP